MEVKQINQLMLAMGRTGIKKLTMKKDNFELHLEREEKAPLKFDASLEFEDNPMRVDFERHRQAHVFTPHVDSQKAIPQKQTGGSVDEKADDQSGLFITSPMVGTVYLTSAPNEPQFVKVGDRVEKNTIVCIVEAMKVMNEVKAGVSGVVAEFLVENGQPVEFGTRILRVIP